eukprot:scaffold288762_cov16-Tisochrysis_lutea.AAC.2
MGACSHLLELRKVHACTQQQTHLHACTQTVPISICASSICAVWEQHDVPSTLGLALGACGLDDYDATALVVEPVANEQWVEQIKVNACAMRVLRVRVCVCVCEIYDQRAVGGADQDDCV